MIFLLQFLDDSNPFENNLNSFRKKQKILGGAKKEPSELRNSKQNTQKLGFFTPNLKGFKNKRKINLDILNPIHDGEKTIFFW